MASFDRTIPPGGRGSITLEIHTRGYQGQVQKSAVVMTNDPEHSKQVIVLTVFIRAR